MYCIHSSSYGRMIKCLCDEVRWMTRHCDAVIVIQPWSAVDHLTICQEDHLPSDCCWLGNWKVKLQIRGDYCMFFCVLDSFYLVWQMCSLFPLNWANVKTVDGRLTLSPRQFRILMGTVHCNFCYYLMCLMLCYYK